MVFNEERVITDETGYNYVKVSPKEILNWGGYCVCNGCNNQFLNEYMYLIFALADVYCEECFKEIKERWKTLSKEDIDYDISLQNEQSLNWYKYHLDDEFKKEIEKKNKIENDLFKEAMMTMLENEDFQNFLKENKNGS